MSVKNYKNAVSIVANVANLGDKLGRAQGWSSKAALLGGSLFTLGASIAKIDLKTIKEEIKAATAEEKAEVNKEFDAQLSLANVKLEELVENTVDFAIAAKGIYDSGLKLLAEVKALKTDKVQA